MPTNMTRKSGATRRVIVESEYPDLLLPPLPDEVRTRFPEMGEWQRTATDNYGKLIDVILRQEAALASRITDLEARIVELEATP